MRLRPWWGRSSRRQLSSWELGTEAEAEAVVVEVEVGADPDPDPGVFVGMGSSKNWRR